MPTRIWKGAARPPGDKGKPISPEMARALEALTIAAMDRYRRGYAHSVRGPFFELGTIEALWRRGLLDYSPAVKRAYVTREGRAALAEWRNKQTTTEAA